jgi:hypothetical protein
MPIFIAHALARGIKTESAAELFTAAAQRG